jgi:hypothetical protein
VLLRLLLPPPLPALSCPVLSCGAATARQQQQPNKMMNELKKHEKNGEKVFLFSRT